MKRNIRISVAYDGTNYLGWQYTPEGPSIEGTLRAALMRILQHDIVLQAAGRTDAGVHADCQEANFFTDRDILDLEKITAGLNALIPRDIRILNTFEEREGFHPTLDCIGKEYRYELCCGKIQMPCRRLYEWHYPCAPDVGKMRKAASCLIGEHDFAAFANVKKNEPYKDTIRNISAIEIVECPQESLRVHIRGNHFLYKMVRNIVGTLVYAAAGRLEVKAVEEILRGKDRKRAGVTAPAHGLYLQRIFFP